MKSTSPCFFSLPCHARTGRTRLVWGGGCVGPRPGGALDVPLVVPRAAARFEVVVDVATRSLVLSGEFDVASAGAVTVCAAALRDQNPGEVAVDLAAVVCRDAAGISALVTLFHDPPCQGMAALRVSDASRALRRVFEAVGLAQLLPPASPDGESTQEHQ